MSVALSPSYVRFVPTSPVTQCSIFYRRQVCSSVSLFEGVFDITFTCFHIHGEISVDQSGAGYIIPIPSLAGRPLHKRGRVWCRAYTRVVPSQPGLRPNQIAPRHVCLDGAVPSMRADQSDASYYRSVHLLICWGYPQCAHWPIRC